MDPGWIDVFQLGATGPGTRGLVDGPSYGTPYHATLRAGGYWSTPTWNELSDKPSKVADSGFSDAVYSVGNSPIGFDSGSEGAKPSAQSSNNGFIYIATDTHRVFRSNGAIWEEIGGSGPVFKGDTVTAQASANLYTDGFGVIYAYAITDGGRGYNPENPPQILVMDGVGHGADITAEVSGDGVITDLHINSGGADYYSPMVTIEPPPTAPNSIPGLVPAAAHGDAAQGKFLAADGKWTAIPAFEAGNSGGKNPMAGLVTGPQWYDTGKFLRGDGIWAYPNVDLFTAGVSGSDPGTPGAVPGPSANDVSAGSFLRADGSWYGLGVFQAYTGASGPAGKDGLVPFPNYGGRGSVDPGEYLNAAGQWTKPVAPTMQAASDSVAGAGGSVPEPQAGANKLFLRGDGTWQPLVQNTFHGQITTSFIPGGWFVQKDEMGSITGVDLTGATPMTYGNVPTIKFLDDEGYGYGAEGHVTMANGYITGIVITSPGIDYSTPSILLYPGAGQVPSPEADDATSGKFLKANGKWSVPGGNVATMIPTIDNNGNFYFKDEGYVIVKNNNGYPAHIWLPPAVNGRKVVIRRMTSYGIVEIRSSVDSTASAINGTNCSPETSNYAYVDNYANDSNLITLVSDGVDWYSLEDHVGIQDNSVSAQ